MYPCNLPQHVPHITTPSQHFITMQAEEYWLMAREYGIWNAAIASLQFWTDDLAPTTLEEASERVYNYFFWTPISHTLCQLPEEILFGCFVLTLNAAFMQHLSSQDEGYDSGSNEDVLTPLHTAPCIHHVSSLDNASFNPVHSTPHRMATCTPTHSPARSVRPHLSFNDDSMDTTASPDNSSPQCSDLETEEEEEEDFQTVPLDDEFWSAKIIPEQTFCIHENGLPTSVCSYPCPYGHQGTTSYIDSLDLSDISDLEDHFLTTSNGEELPTFEED